MIERFECGMLQLYTRVTKLYQAIGNQFSQCPSHQTGRGLFLAQMMERFECGMHRCIISLMSGKETKVL